MPGAMPEAVVGRWGGGDGRLHICTATRCQHAIKCRLLYSFGSYCADP